MILVFAVLIFHGNALKVSIDPWIVEKDYCTSQTGTDGICLDITDCKIFYDYVRENSFTNKVKQTILKYRCGRPSSQKVCCPYKVPPELERPKTLDFTKHANYNLLPTRCGITQTNKITNGNETNLFDYPWAVAIKYNIRELPWGCGGSLISDRYVLTAAHCIRNNNTITTVRLGEHDFNQDPDCEVNDEGQRRCAQKVQDFAYTKGDAIVHPSYNEKTNENDIALIRLPKPAILAINGALPICIPTKKAEITKTFTDYIVIGWGRTHNDFKSSVLLQANVPKVEIPDCAPNFVPDRILTDNQMCAGGKNEQDSCNGDSGGPLMADYVSDGELRTMQYGIVSVGAAACGTSGFPTVYTRVDKYVGWILDNMRP